MSKQHYQSELTPLIIRHQQAIYGYIYSLLPNRAVAEDVLQDTFVTVVEKFEEFDSETSFVAWVRAIAYWKVRQAKTSFARSKIFFSESLTEVLNQDMAEIGDGMSEQRHQALDRCLGKLKERDRKLVLGRYLKDKQIKDVASETGRSTQAAYKALMRIRRGLMSCVEKELLREGA